MPTVELGRQAGVDVESSLVNCPASCFDVGVIGGGPAGLAASLWAARYRRRVVLVDGGAHRNRYSDATHGYLAQDGVAPDALLERARNDLDKYPEVTALSGVVVCDVQPDADGFVLTLSDDSSVRALRLVLATGVRDILPPIENFGKFYGTTVFSCPSCDGYEAQGKSVVVIGHDEHIPEFAIGLLDWASDVTVVVGEELGDRRSAELLRMAATGINVVVGEPLEMFGADGRLRAVGLAGGSRIPCEIAFCTIRHEQHSNLARDLGCRISEDGCVCVDEDCLTSQPHIYAAGDMTPGPQLVQVAAAEGATAGIAAATSLRGEAGAPRSPTPAPDPDTALSSQTPPR